MIRRKSFSFFRRNFLRTFSLANRICEETCFKTSGRGKRRCAGEVGVELAFKRQLRAAEDPAALRQQLLAAAEARPLPIQNG